MGVGVEQGVKVELLQELVDSLYAVSALSRSPLSDDRWSHLMNVRLSDNTTVCEWNVVASDVNAVMQRMPRGVSLGQDILNTDVTVNGALRLSRKYPWMWLVLLFWISVVCVVWLTVSGHLTL